MTGTAVRMEFSSYGEIPDNIIMCVRVIITQRKDSCPSRQGMTDSDSNKPSGRITPPAFQQAFPGVFGFFRFLGFLELL